MNFLNRAKEIKTKIQNKMEENERKAYDRELNKTLELEKKAKRVGELSGLQKRQELAQKKIKEYNANTPMGKFVSNASKQANMIDKEYSGMSFESGSMRKGKSNSMGMSIGSNEPKRKSSDNFSIGIGINENKKKKNRDFMF